LRLLRFLLLALAAALALDAQQAPVSSIAKAADEARIAGRDAESIRLYGNAVAQDPRDDSSLWFLGNLQYKAKDFPAAASTFRKLSELKPDLGPAWAFQGLAQFRLNRFDAALDSLEKARLLGVPDEALDNNARLYQALLSSRVGRFEAALALLSPFAAQDRHQPLIIAAHGIAALRKKALPHELPATEQALVMSSGEAAFAIGARRMDEARGILEELIRDNPATSGLHYMLALTVLRVDREHAFRELEREIELTPDHLMAYLQMASENLDNGQAVDALEYARRAAAVLPDSYMARAMHGRVLLAANRSSEAVTELETAVRLAPQVADVHFQLATAYAREGRDAEARQHRKIFQDLRKLEEGGQ
jgi:tetratricopeptide (TPR) repeat protein